MARPLATLTVTPHLPADRRRATIEGAIEQLVAEVSAGIEHGHFSITVSGGDATGGHTEVMIHAGKIYRFLIPKGSKQHKRADGDPR